MTAAKACLLFALILSASAGEASKEYQLKAAFLYNFAKFVEWPPAAFTSPQAPIVIGIVGENPFGGDLERAVKDRSISGHPVEIRMFNGGDTNVFAHVLFFAPGEAKAKPGLLIRLGDMPVLTVGESDRFLEQGGIINFLFEGDKVRFEINPGAASRAGLRISANLQKLATKSRTP